MKFHDRVNRLFRLVEPVCLQEDFAQHSQQRWLARLRRQALAENAHGRLDIPTLHGNGSNAPVGTLIVGIKPAGLGCDLVCGVIPLFRHRQFEVGEQHVGIVGGNGGRRPERSSRLWQVALGSMPSREGEPCRDILRIDDGEMLKDDQSRVWRLELRRQQVRQQYGRLAHARTRFRFRVRDESLGLHIESNDRCCCGGGLLELAAAGERPDSQGVDGIQVEGRPSIGPRRGGGACWGDGHRRGNGHRRGGRDLLSQNRQFLAGIAEPSEADHPFRESAAEQEVIRILADCGFEHAVGVATVVLRGDGAFGKLDHQAGKFSLRLRVVWLVGKVSRKQPQRLRGIALLLLGARHSHQGTRISANLKPVDEGNGDQRRGCDGQHRDQHADVKAFRRTIHRIGGLSRRWENRYF